MNAAQVVGYEQHVGSKETFRFINRILQTGLALKHFETRKGWITTVRDSNLILVPRLDNRTNTDIIDDTNSVFVLNQTIQKQIADFHEEHRKVPSTGLISVMTMLEFFEQVHLFGFNFYGGPYPTHYWETCTKDGNNSHKWEIERNWIEQNERIIRI